MNLFRNIERLYIHAKASRLVNCYIAQRLEASGRDQNYTRWCLNHDLRNALSSDRALIEPVSRRFLDILMRKENSCDVRYIALRALTKTVPLMGKEVGDTYVCQLLGYAEGKESREDRLSYSRNTFYVFLNQSPNNARYVRECATHIECDLLTRAGAPCTPWIHRSYAMN